MDFIGIAGLKMLGLCLVNILFLIFSFVFAKWAYDERKQTENKGA